LVGDEAPVALAKALQSLMCVQHGTWMRLKEPPVSVIGGSKGRIALRGWLALSP